MRICGMCVLLSACVFALAGCGRSREEPARSFAYAVPEPVRMAYETLLSGDLSLFDDAEVRTWALDEWMELILCHGEVEYTCLDLDGDGIGELLIQSVDDPCSYNGVFHYDGDRLCCWQNDGMDGSCRDYPLQDGTMVRQYDFNGARSYTLFRYQADGEREILVELLAREELAGEDRPEPYPYYQIDGEEVEPDTFYEQLDVLITDQLLDRSVWTAF